MRRLLLVSLSAAGLLAPISAGAVELPVRKAGLWEMKVLSGGSTPESGSETARRSEPICPDRRRYL